jgi:hypothetical protein
MNRVMVGFVRNVNFLYRAEQNVLTAHIPMPADIPWRVKTATNEGGDMVIVFEPVMDSISPSPPPSVAAEVITRLIAPGYEGGRFGSRNAQ